jgi:hypothetical protein
MVGNRHDDAKRYRRYAAECRRMAERLPPDQKPKLLEIAQAWDESAKLIDGKDRDDDGASQ